MRCFVTEGQSATDIKIYHIIHVNRLDSVLKDGFLFCDAEMSHRQNVGPTIGISNIKERRMLLKLSSFPDLTVGQCVPFYFAPRSVMLYVIKCENHPDLAYSNGQEDILHLEFNLQKVLNWAQDNGLKTCYTTSNAGSRYFEDYSDFTKIKDNIDWAAVDANQWSGTGIDKSVKENKQAEFLIENRIPIELLELVGVYNLQNYNKVNKILKGYNLSVNVKQKVDWYY